MGLMRLGEPRETYNNKILICDECEGAGYTSKDHLADYHRGEYETTYHICRWCGGTGRLKQTQKIVTTIDRIDDSKVKEIMFEKLKE